LRKKIKKPKDEKAFRELPDSIKKRPRNDNRPSVQDRIRNRPERFFSTIKQKTSIFKYRWYEEIQFRFYGSRKN
jgi:hypothetical protein